MSAQSDFEKFMREIIGAIKAESGGKHDKWRIGSVLLSVPHDLGGMRGFRNTKAQALRIAREQGLLNPERRAKARVDRQEHKRGPRPQQSHRRSVSSGSRRDLEAWNIREAIGWKSLPAGLEGLMSGIGGDERGHGRLRVPTDERLPGVLRVLGEAGTALQPTDIAAHLGVQGNLTEENAIRRVLNSRPDLFQEISGNRRNRRRYQLRRDASRQDLDVASKSPPVVPVEAAGAPEAGANQARTLERIKSLVAAYEESRYDPHAAVYTLGRIAEIVRRNTTTNPAS